MILHCATRGAENRGDVVLKNMVRRKEGYGDQRDEDSN